MSKDTMIAQLDKVFSKFDEKVTKLDKIGVDAWKSITSLLKIARRKKLNAIDDPHFRSQLDVLKRVKGQTDYMVFAIELERQKLQRPEVLAEQTVAGLREAQKNQITPIVVNAAAQQPDGQGQGVWSYMIERRRSGTLEKALEASRTPQLTLAKRPQDILNYCRDVTAELNKLYDWILGVQADLSEFNDQARTNFHYGSFIIYLEKLSNVMIGFSQAIVEYRKERVDERQVAYAQAIAVMEQAKYMAQAGRVMPTGGYSNYGSPSS